MRNLKFISLNSSVQRIRYLYYQHDNQTVAKQMRHMVYDAMC